MFPDFPKAKKLIDEQIFDFFEKQIEYHSQGLIANIPKRIIQEGDGFYTEYSKDLSHQSEMRPIHTSFEYSTKEVLENPNIIFDKLDRMAKDAAYQQTVMIFDSISEVTEKVGNVVKSKGKMTAEDIFNVFEKIVIDFNKDGTARMPTIHAGEQMTQDAIAAFKEIDETPELRERFNKIMEKQKSDWHDRENNRELVG